MEFPVDILATLSHEDLEHSAEDYMSDLLYSNPDKAEHFSLPNSRRIPLSISNVGFVPLYGSDLRHKVLALFAPEDQFTAVALYLADQWWSVEDILKTADPSRKGLFKVRSLGERIVLYVLNRIVYRSKEMSKSEVPFLCHSASDYVKILWTNGEAVGFYSVKPTGSLCNSFLTQRYHLPVMDSVFVRKIHRGNGYGLQILEDFVDCFKEDSLGLKYPISQAMFKVCGQYLNTYPADRELLWEVESVGGPFQRHRIASKLQTIAVNVTCHTGGDALLHENSAENDVAMEEEMQNETLSNSVDVTEVLMVNKHLRAEDTPVSTRTRSSDYSRKRIREDTEEVTEESLPEKITRMDDSAKVERSEGAAPEEDGQLAPADGEGEGEEQPAPTEEEVEDADKGEPSPLNEEVEEPVAQETLAQEEEEPVAQETPAQEEEEPVAQETPAQEEENQTLEMELLAKVEAEKINGEITDDFGEEEGESTGEPAAVDEESTQEKEGDQKDVDMEEIVEDKDVGSEAPEESEERTTAAEEAMQAEQTSLAKQDLPAEQEQISPVEEAMPAVEEPASPVEEALPAEEEQTSPVEEALPAEEEPASPVEEALPAEEEQTSPVEEALPAEEEPASPVEEALPAEEEQTSPEEEALPAEEEPASPVEEALPAEEEQTSPVEAAPPVDEQTSPAEEALSSEEQTSPAQPEEEAQPVKDEGPPEEAMEVDDSSSAAGEALAVEQVSSVNEDTPVNSGEDAVDHQKAPEVEEPSPEVADVAIAVPDKVMPEDEEEGMEAKLSTEAAPFEKVDSPSKPSPPLDKDKMDLSQDAVLLVGLKEVTYHLNGDNENDQTAAAVEKMEEEVPKGEDAEQGKETEEERATSTEGEEDGETVEQSSDDAGEPPVVDMRVLRRKTKVIQATPKRKSTRINKRPLEDDQTEPSEPEDESTEKEEEKATSTEEEVVEKSSDEVDESPVVDRRVLRQKTKVNQSSSKPKTKRRTKS
ncbi:hypothetical protein SKAU_G00361100 [Synaphobranchus kaupii]|uniref:Soluble lamin-associated protein of 75 kDa n=1 Tax=Synaphobranchus kaupii TaxID=118154 RepID=A0A9Q1EIA6_SYNKA|nr:hypothetical protein SKAU_G00361100 [Synaphobranchus kaupii]